MAQGGRFEQDHRHMTRATKDDITRSIGAQSDFLIGEILRTDASRHEWRRAITFVVGQTTFEPAKMDALSPRLRRLVDLIAAADSVGQSTSAAPISSLPFERAA